MGLNRSRGAVPRCTALPALHAAPAARHASGMLLRAQLCRREGCSVPGCVTNKDTSHRGGLFSIAAENQQRLNRRAGLWSHGWALVLRHTPTTVSGLLPMHLALLAGSWPQDQAKGDWVDIV